ncbi:MAG: OPT family oligopeptide transporter [Deltaproteobacteria bacterium]|nr:MAG: OPT family oligopeptide transporter [Deltaproteobacteria bacterium]
MALFQKAPKTPEEAAQYGPLDIAPDQVLEMDEATWYEKVYRGEHVPQLTVRAVLMGMFLGGALAFTNLYIGLKTGWGLGIAITACILSFALWRLFLSLKIAKSPMTILETNCMQSTASSAGYATGSAMVSAIPALLMLSATPENPQGEHVSIIGVGVWTLLLAALGTLMAVPMKRNLINKDRLKFPSGTAAAVTLQALYSHGDQAIKKARALLIGMGVGAIFPLLIELKVKIVETREGIIAGAANIFDWLPALGKYHGKDTVPSDWTLVMDTNPVMIAAGAIIGVRTAFWMVVGGLALAYGLGPAGLTDVWTNPAGADVTAVTAPYKAWKESGIWFGVPIMVTSGLLAFALQWRTIVRAFKGFGKGAGAIDARVLGAEVPGSWFLYGMLVFGAGICVAGEVWFHIPWYYGVIAIVMTFFLALVAARATGETDITPIGAMGKITQLTYGVLIPQSTTANLMTASITANCATSSADLLNDLKSGYLLGAHPRRQFVAQFMGIFMGTVAMVGGYYLLVPDATTLLGQAGQAPEFPAPAAQAWKAVAEIFKYGLDNMHPTHRALMLWGGGLGIVLVLLERYLPKMKQWLPSATGLGLGLILPFQYPFAMLVGAIIGWAWHTRNKQQSETYLVPVAAGLIAGISIMGVIVAIINLGLPD